MTEAKFWLQAVARRFPERGRDIEALSAQPGPFRDMCEELAEALMALEATDRAPAEVREARRDEWRATVETLLQEIGEALRDAEAVRIRPGPIR